MDKIVMVNINELCDFKCHPYKVEQNSELFELTRSIEQEGVIVPILVRNNPNGKGYEIISGHRRKEASKWAGIDKIPAVIRDMTDDQAVVAMVDSNLQREHLKPSEKAYAYRMKLEALVRQGKDVNSSLCHVGTQDNETVKMYKVELIDTVIGYEIKNSEKDNRDTSGDKLARETGESRRQIYRFIRLTYLVPKILDMVDEDKIAFTIGVELSYLSEEEQYELYAVMDLEQCTPSLSQANRIKRKSQSGELDLDMIYEIMGEEKPNQKDQIRIRAELLDDYFPDDFTPKQKVELIEKLVREWHDKEILMKK